MPRIFIVAVSFAGLFLSLARPAAAFEAHDDILGGPYDGTFDSVEAINFVSGASLLYDAGYFGQRTIIANVEAGHIWGGHEVFDRTGLPYPASPALLINGTRNPLTAPMLGDLDIHATMVGHVLAGTGLTEGGNLSLLGAGMAPLATLWSGAIATSFATDVDHLGEFETDKAAFLVPYRAFFEGTLGHKADVINSSWGYEDPAAREEYTVILDALASENPTVTMVKSAGNGGPAAAPGGPGSGYNGITVGALGGSGDARPYLRPADYTSGAPADFYDPVTHAVVTGVRAGVSIAAPGDDLALAYYGGKTGSLAALGSDPPLATDLYFVFNQSGTSFSSPVVAGGVALLKDVAYGGIYLDPAAHPEVLDTRVIKSVIMAGADRTTGWDNGQHLVGNVVTTTQSLDYAVGAGRLDLEDAALIYVAGTKDVPGDEGGTIAPLGWDIGIVGLHEANDYFFDLSAAAGLELTVSLNWFVNASFDTLTETAAAQSFADLDLEVWIVSGGVFLTKVAESASPYNNSEFLRFILPETGLYGIRVTFDNVRYDATGSLASETYGLAWQVAAVPEPAEWGTLMAAALGVLIFARFRRAKFVSKAR